MTENGATAELVLRAVGFCTKDPGAALIHVSKTEGTGDESKEERKVTRISRLTQIKGF